MTGWTTVAALGRGNARSQGRSANARSAQANRRPRSWAGQTFGKNIQFTLALLTSIVGIAVALTSIHQYLSPPVVTGPEAESPKLDQTELNLIATLEDANASLTSKRRAARLLAASDLRIVVPTIIEAIHATLTPGAVDAQSMSSAEARSYRRFLGGILADLTAFNPDIDTQVGGAAEKTRVVVGAVLDDFSSLIKGYDPTDRNGYRSEHFAIYADLIRDLIESIEGKDLERRTAVQQALTDRHSDLCKSLKVFRNKKSKLDEIGVSRETCRKPVPHAAPRANQ